jgi:hypothetical protein
MAFKVGYKANIDGDLFGKYFEYQDKPTPEQVAEAHLVLIQEWRCQTYDLIMEKYKPEFDFYYTHD